jgi:hypothetical protein
VIAGVGVLVWIMKFMVFEVSGPGFTTVILAVPGLDRSVAEIAASSVVVLKKVVIRSSPFQWILDPFWKLVPSTVRVIPDDPALADVGSRLEILGTEPTFMVKVLAAEISSVDGLRTVMFAVPAVARSLAGIEAFS